MATHVEEAPALQAIEQRSIDCVAEDERHGRPQAG
jgi:hypothetical protein